MAKPEGEKGAGLFPTTRITALRAIASADGAERARSMDTLARVYWRPLYKYVRVKWRKSSEEARDLTQGFFTAALQTRTFEAYDPARARFRTFIRACLDHYVAKDGRSRGAAKRGGHVGVVHLDVAQIEAELSATDVSPENAEDFYHQEWIRHLFELAVETLRRECQQHGREQHFTLFERYDLTEDEKPSYAALASEIGIKVTDVTNRLSSIRRRFRRIVLETLREVTGTDDEFRSEAKAVLGVTL